MMVYAVRKMIEWDGEMLMGVYTSYEAAQDAIEVLKEKDDYFLSGKYAITEINLNEPLQAY
jgi:hypothetical protein